MSVTIARLGSLATLALALSAPASALDEIVGERGWVQVDYVEDGACRAEVRTNGQFYRIAQQGLQPGERVDFHLQNSNVRPVEYRFVANADGAWREFYVPFLWHRDGGTVIVALDSASCSQSLSFDWRRRQVD